MIVLLSPAKTLDFEKPDRPNATQPQFIDKTEILASVLKKYKPADLKSLMSISDNLAELNYDRFQNMAFHPQTPPVKAALDVFEGDVYKGIEAETMNDQDWGYAQQHLRILSGLYGILKPLDTIQPYRLEMGTQLNIRNKFKNLYAFWKEELTRSINEELNAQESPFLINLASKEYFKALDKRQINAPILEVQFKEWRQGKLKFISFNAKKARGLMARYIIDHKLEDPQHLKGFTTEGYQFEPELSSENSWMFTREN